MAENKPAVKKEVRQFYDQIGWKMEATGFYQNARYEDLRPVSREYIHNCHMRVNRHLAKSGKFLLDAGSGPIQWPEYMTYSEGYQYRVCADLSITGLREAQQRKPGHVLCVVADIANLPFKDDSFDGSVSMHTIHHVPASEKNQAYLEMQRTLKSGQQAVIVNGWSSSPFMARFNIWLNRLSQLKNKVRVLMGRDVPSPKKQEILLEKTHEEEKDQVNETATGTFINKLTPDVLQKELGHLINYSVYPWRSVSTRVMRAFIHPWAFGKQILRWIYRQEEKNPEYYGNNGQYPMIVIKK